MKQNDFYEVNGCTEFIPVTINETYAGGVDVTVNSITHTFRMAVKQVYQFPKQHEPQKVVVPKFVAEWLKEYRHASPLLKVLNAAEDGRVVPSAVNDWILDNQRDFVVAWYDGYEIEQEKLYTVELPNPNNIGTEVHILMMNGFKQVVIKKELGNDWKKKKGFQLTEEEIKKDFEWAWQFREEVD
ncbi:TPA: DUF1642 domain-containing protein [Streptococcus suis]|nr:DUF1642 domain-containing protein [Streptococcus suis]